MTQQHGRRYEHSLSSSLDMITTEDVWVTTAGYSGNAVIDSCDIVLTIDPKLRLQSESIQINVEAKKRQGTTGNRISNVFSGSESGETGVEEINRFVESTPEWAEPVVALKMDRRKLIVLDGRWILWAIGERKQPIPPDCVRDLIRTLEPRTTPSDNISMVKPTTEQWPSATAADGDAVVLAERLGIPYKVTDNE